MMAPVTISASVLTLRATIVLAAAAAAIITILVLWHLPLTLASGAELALPPILAVGVWSSLIIGITFQSTYAFKVTEETFLMSQALSATQMALGREQQISALGGVVAAAAHELGTPLATIKLVSTELAEELENAQAVQSDLREDALLIRDQADRCRDILRAMGPRGKDDTHVHHAPVSSVVEEAAAPHASRGIRIITRVDGALIEDDPQSQPDIARRPEIIQGLRNLIQNAVDFARSTVWIDLSWSGGTLRVVVGDDGPGYPSDLLGRIGDPFVRRRSAGNAHRPGYEGMGLGLFIAKTLLERTGAEISFGNGSDSPRTARLAGPVEYSRPPGAVAAAVWPLARIVRSSEPMQGLHIDSAVTKN
jgi:two-component system sensor histidine kinase RegB